MEYSAVRGGKLTLKGAARLDMQHKKKRGRRKRKKEAVDEGEPGMVRHGRWHKVSSFEDIRDRAVFETFTEGYVFAEDSGYFTVGEPRKEDESPDPAEIFTVVQCSETKVALKSGYGRYVGVNTSGELVGRAEAIGPRETWEPVFEEGKLALCACNHRFLTVTEHSKLMATSEKAREKEILIMRCDAPAQKKSRVESNEEEEASRDLGSFEASYVKKFQSFGDHKLRVCQDSRDGIHHAQQKGKLHEALLDRREKMKADRYCK